MKAGSFVPPGDTRDREQDTRIRFFFYGSLRHGLFNYVKILDGRTIDEQPAQLSGYVLYDAGDFPFAVRKPGCDDLTVVGELMEIKPDQYDDVLHELDELEGVDPSDPGCLFKRVQVEVRTDAGPVTVWVYEAGDTVEKDFTSTDQIPSGDWVSHQNEKRKVSAETNPDGRVW